MKATEIVEGFNDMPYEGSLNSNHDIPACPRPTDDGGVDTYQFL